MKVELPKLASVTIQVAPEQLSAGTTEAAGGAGEDATTPRAAPGADEETQLLEATSSPKAAARKPRNRGKGKQVAKATLIH